MEMDWVIIPDFPDYLISNQGLIINRNSSKPLRVSHTREGAVKVGLVKDGEQCTRSVKVLVAESYVPGKNEIFDTPIHLDGQDDHNAADNIVWRPRWFAWAYKNQLKHVSDNDRIGPLRDVETNIRYYDIYEAAITHGLLFRDVRKSLVTGESTFPTFQVFRMV